MPRLEIALSQIEKLIEQLNEREKIKLVRRLEEETLPSRWRALLRQIDKRRKKYPVSQKEIEETVGKVRQELYERSGA